jgi:hypothetical protein
MVDYEFSEHAYNMLKERDIKESWVKLALEEPDKKEIALQRFKLSMIESPEGISIPTNLLPGMEDAPVEQMTFFPKSKFTEAKGRIAPEVYDDILSVLNLPRAVLASWDLKQIEEDGTVHYIKSIKEYEGRYLRIVANSNARPQKIITLFFDRRIRRQQ